jgi:hypothetical protein
MGPLVTHDNARNNCDTEMLGLLSALPGCAFIPAPCRNLRFRAELQLGLIACDSARPWPRCRQFSFPWLGLCVPSRRRSEHGRKASTVQIFVDRNRVDVSPMLPMRAAIVAAAATTLGILALANLTSVQQRAGVAQQPQLRAPIAASVAYSRDSLAVLLRADSLDR